MSDAAIVALVVLAASLLGIATRAHGMLAAFWPANAILLGIMLRWPHLATPAGWVGAVIGYVAADLVTGDATGRTLSLMAANMVGALTGWLILRRLPHAFLTLQHPFGVIYLFGAVLAGSVVAGVLGSDIFHKISQGEPLDGFKLWFTTEVVNYVILLPVILVWPSREQARLRLHRQRRWRDRQPVFWLPLLAIALCGVASFIFGGPSAFIYATPALVWSAMTYSLFPTTVLVFAICMWEMLAIGLGLSSMPQSGTPMESLTSMRLALALVAIAPIAVASSNAARDRLLERLRHTAHHDGLTGLLLRKPFLAAAGECLAKAEASGRSFVIAMMDLDHFKHINDAHGHAVGDRALEAFSLHMQRLSAAGHLVGRLGGEEFALAVIVGDTTDVADLLEQTRSDVESIVFEGANGESLGLTVSGGAAVRKPGSGASIEALLAEADKALYRAKSGGRNRVVFAD